MVTTEPVTNASVDLTPEQIAPLLESLNQFVELWTSVHVENEELLSFYNGIRWDATGMQRLVDLWSVIMHDDMPVNAEQLKN